MNWLGRRNWAEAERSARSVLADTPDDKRASEDLVEALHRQGRLEGALAACAAALDRKPSARLHFSRWLVELELNQVDAAKVSLVATAEFIDRAGADDAGSLLVASRVAAMLGDIKAAVGAAQRAVILNPHDPRALTQLGGLLIDLDSPLAEQRLRQSLKLDPEQAEAQNDLGTALLRQRKAEEAYQAFSAALELAPDYTLAATNLWALDVAKRRKSLFFPLVMVSLLGATWLSWTAVSFGREPHISWPRLGAALVLMLFGISVEKIADRLRPRDALSQKVHTEMNEGRLGHQAAVPVLRFSSHFLLAFGLCTTLGSAITAFFVTREYLASHNSSALLGMGLGLAGMVGGGVLIYESRKLKRQAETLRADRS